MPSAARQKIPADLWRFNHNRSLGSSPVPSHSQDIQAHPGLYDLSSDVEAIKNQNGRRGANAKSSKKCPRNRKNGHVNMFPRRGSSDALNVSVATSYANTKSSCELSTSADSDSGVHYSYSRESPNSFALDSTEAPHPSVLPLPPLEWMAQRGGGSPSSTLESLSFLGYFASSQNCV